MPCFTSYYSQASRCLTVYVHNSVAENVGKGKYTLMLMQNIKLTQCSRFECRCFCALYNPARPHNPVLWASRNNTGCRHTLWASVYTSTNGNCLCSPPPQCLISLPGLPVSYCVCPQLSWWKCWQLGIRSNPYAKKLGSLMFKVWRYMLLCTI